MTEAKRKQSITDVLDEKIAKRVKSLVNAMSLKRKPAQGCMNVVSNVFNKFALYCCHIIFAVLNILMLLCGLGITALSGYLYYSMANLKITDNILDFPLPVATFIFGSLIIVLAIFGFACTGRSHCLVLYSSCLIIIMLLESLLALHIYVNYAEEHASGRYKELFKKVFQESISHYSDDKEAWKFVDRVQRDYECCGVNSSEDWYTTPLKMVPYSCCEEECTLSMDSVYKKGCPEKLQSDFKNKEERCYLLTTLAMPLAIVYTAVAIPINSYFF